MKTRDEAQLRASLRWPRLRLVYMLVGGGEPEESRAADAGERASLAGKVSQNLKAAECTSPCQG